MKTATSSARRLVSGLLAAAMLAVSTAGAVWADDAKTPEDEWASPDGQQSQQDAADAQAKADFEAAYQQLSDRYKKIQAQLESIKKQKSSVTSKKKSAQEKKAMLQQEITLTEEKIEVLKETIAQTEADIAYYEEEIAHKEEEIALKQQEIDAADQELKDRLRAMQLSGMGSDLDALLGAGSFGDVMLTAVNQVRVAEHDQAIIDDLYYNKHDLETKKGWVEEAKAENERKRQSLEADRADLDASIEELESLTAQVNGEIQQIAAEEQELSAEQEDIQKQLEAIENEIQSIIANNSGDTVYGTGEFIWPLPGYTKITSNFGQREISGQQDSHTGVDISGSGVNGANIVAADSGKVIAVRDYTSGYGKHLILDHGDGKTTVYAHCSAILVSEGEVVLQGQTIARVGSTGWSTGPHLHFEVRINGKAVNPLQYFSGI